MSGVARPRSASIDAAILDAVRSILREDGYGQLSIDRVAALAGVSRATVYRRWPTRASLAVAALQHSGSSPRGGPGPATAPDTGSLRGDLRELVDRLVEAFGATESVGAMGGIVAEMATNPTFSQELQQAWLDPDEQELAVVFARARARGEADGEVDGAEVLSTLAGAVLYRLVVLHRPCPPQWREDLTNLFLHGAGTAAPGPGR